MLFSNFFFDNLNRVQKFSLMVSHNNLFLFISFVHSFIHSFLFSSFSLVSYFDFSSFFIRPFLPTSQHFFFSPSPSFYTALIYFLLSSSHFCSFSRHPPQRRAKNWRTKKHIVRVMMTIRSKTEKGYLTSVRVSEKKRDRQEKRRGKNRGEKCGPFSSSSSSPHTPSLSLCVSFHLSFSRVLDFRKSRERKKKRKKEKKRKNDRILSPNFEC